MDNKDFNSDISLWDVGNGTDFSLMFYGTSFNQDISAWDVSNATNFTGMFAESSFFNQDISDWDVSNATDLTAMFMTFNQNIGRWNLQWNRFFICFKRLSRLIKI